MGRQAIDCAVLIVRQAEFENNTKLKDEYTAIKDLAVATMSNATKFKEEISVAHALMYTAAHCQLCATLS